MSPVSLKKRQMFHDEHFCTCLVLLEYGSLQSKVGGNLGFFLSVLMF